jgi:hypothetical protein
VQRPELLAGGDRTHPDESEYWSWVAGALYILLTADLLTTLYAADIHGVAAEANPYMRWALGEGLSVVVILNVSALVVLAGLFAGYFRLLRTAEGTEAWVLARSFEVWIGGVIAVGLFVFANNLAVIVYGRSLI